MATPRSVRLDSVIEERFESFLARHQGLNGSAALNRLIDEGIRMDLVPGVHFRDGVNGRRAAIVGGPEVWEVASVVRAMRMNDEKLSDQAVASRVAEVTSISPSQFDIALSYWAQFNEEIDQLVDSAWAEEDRLLALEAEKQELIRA